MIGVRSWFKERAKKMEGFLHCELEGNVLDGLQVEQGPEPWL